MSRRRLTLALAVSLLGGAPAFVHPAAASALQFGECSQSPGFTCTTLTVPLERGGGAPGMISLGVERRTAGLSQASSAVLALAGGPGQATLPLGEFILRILAPALAGRDLLLFDQRGTGTSDPLSCPNLSVPLGGPVGGLIERCALTIGPARGGFTTGESVADIEALRQAAGYRQLVLYGTSYGTKVALQYAARYPAHVEALVLDSVVPADGPEPLEIPSFQAIGPALEELCSGQACAGVTSNPVRDMASLAARLHRHAFTGSAYNGSGRRISTALSESGLLEVLQAGDLNPALRALLPAAVGSALRGDPDPLVRLHLLAEGLIPSVPREPVEGAQTIDEALFLTTSCEETPFPWQRSGGPGTRLAEAHAAVRALPSSSFYPFDARTAIAGDLIPFCAYWPDASPTPAPLPALPNVPTLILSGAQDLRTPTSTATRVAAQIPDAQLEVVPHTGHSVIGSDFTGCAQTSLAAFFGATPVRPCPPGANTFAPTPMAPTKLAYLHAPKGLAGRPGRTLTAVVDAIVDLNRQVIGATLQADQELPSGSSFGGLRGGYATLTSTQAVLKRFSFVPGVELSGVFPVRNGMLQPATIRVSGTQASPGTVTFGLHKRVSGTLGGRTFALSVARLRLARAPDKSEWPAAPVRFPVPGLAREQPARLP